MQIPAVGTQVSVVIENIGRRRDWEPLVATFEGLVAPTHKWLDADYFCLTTNDPGFTIRSIRKSWVKSITVAGTTVEQTAPAKPVAAKTGVWQVKGSKGDIYNVSRNGDRWGCDCVAGQFGRSTCKHIKSIQAAQMSEK